MIRDIFEDIRFALRQFLRERSVTVVLVLTIALGIGVNTAIYGMLNGFQRPLAVKAPEQLVVLAARIKGDETGIRFNFSYPALQDFRKQAEPFSDVFAYNPMISGLSTGGKSVQFFYSAVTGNYFTGLGIVPVLGRVFEPGEGESYGSELPVVLGYSFWQKNFGGDPGVVGRQIRIDGRAATVVGVTPREFHGLYAGAEMQGYLPLRSMITEDAPWRRDLFTNRTVRPLTVFARLKPTVTLAQAQTAATVLARRIAADNPATDKDTGVQVIPEILARPIPLNFLTELVPVVRFFVLLLAGLVLLVACLNVANIQLVRVTVRQRELAIRAAMGSGRARLVRQMLTESMLLALAGGGAGILLGRWTANAISSSLDLATDLPVLIDFSFDARVFAYGLAVSLATGLVIGVWPALRASKANAAATLKDGGWSGSGGPGRQRMRGLLVLGQVAGSLVVLICAGLFVRSLRNAERVDLGFNAENVLNARMDPMWAGYGLRQTQDFYRELGRRVKAWPEVQSASFAFSVPLGYINAGQVVRIEGRASGSEDQPPAVGCNFIDEGYFATMQIPILRGRPIRESDTEDAPLVAVINESMANRFWPNENPLGKRFYAGAQSTGPWEVVGIARNSKYLVVFEDALPHFYVPVAQNFTSMRVLQIRSTVSPDLLKARLEKEIQTLDPDVPLADVQTMKRSLGGAQGFFVFRIGAFQGAALGLLGLVLAVVGVYGVVAYGAVQRTREIGIRIALGATPAAIRAIVLRQGLAMVGAGVGVGLAAAIALTRVLKRFLLLVSATDPYTFIAVPALLVFVALGACYLPARRATKVDPMVALRHD